MQFSDEIKEAYKAKFDGTGVTVTDEEVNNYLNQAWNMFNTANRGVIPPSQATPANLWVAIGVLKPIVLSLFPAP